MGDAQLARRPTLSYIGHPIHFVSGQFAGRTVRTELIEIQKADLGRKYARVDRRPLDPPPVVLLKIFFVFHPGTDREFEKEVENYEEIENLGLLCNVDLFHVPPCELKETPTNNSQQRSDGSQSHLMAYGSPTASSCPSESQHFTFSAHNPYASPQNPLPMPALPLPQPSSSSYLPSDTNTEVIAHVGNYAITEHSKRTQALVGATFVQPSNVDYKGKKCLMFVFADLAVKIEGTFILRYRVFDIFSKGYNADELAVQAECYGGPFRVYSTKEFPGLQASTDLTKQLARWGVRLNIREAERKRRKKDERSNSPPAKGKRKKAVDRDGGASDDD